jgi:hypothetical protein
VEHPSFEALTVGPAASDAFSTPGSLLRVHSVFSSTANLAVEGSDFLVALTGPRGAAWPQAVALRSFEDFDVLPLGVGDPGRLADCSLRLETRGGTVSLDFGAAARPARRVLATISDLDKGGAFHDCVLRLQQYQARIHADLRIDAVMGLEMGPGNAMAPPGAALCRSARAFCSVVRAQVRGGAAVERIREIAARRVSALLGAGRGLTPSGDDFLCGFLAAVRSARPKEEGSRLAAMEIDDAICASIEEMIDSTGEVSASLLRLAMRGFWSGPVTDLVQGLAIGDASGTPTALDELCAIGHTSGADIATGFLVGHHAFLQRADRPSWKR